MSLENVVENVEVVGRDGVTLLVSGIGIRRSERGLLLLFDDSLFFFRLKDPNKLDGLSPGVFTPVGLSTDEDDRRVEVDSRFEARQEVYGPASFDSCSFSFRAFLSPTFSIFGAVQITSNISSWRYSTRIKYQEKVEEVRLSM